MPNCHYCNRRPAEPRATLGSTSRCEHCQRLHEQSRNLALRAKWLGLVSIPLMLLIIPLHFLFYNEARYLVGAAGFLAASLTICLIPLEVKLAETTYCQLKGIRPRSSRPAETPVGRWDAWKGWISSARARFGMYGALACLWVVGGWWMLVRDTPSWVIRVEPNVQQLAFSTDGTSLLVSGTFESQLTTAVIDWKRKRKSVDDAPAKPPAPVTSTDPDEIAGEKFDSGPADNRKSFIGSVPPGQATQPAYFLISPDGNMVATFTIEGIGTLALPSAEASRVFEFKEFGIPIAFSPDGRRLASWDFKRTGQLRLWNTETGTEVSTLKPGSEVQSAGRPVYEIAFHPDNLRLVTTTFKGPCQFWEIGSAQLLLTLTENSCTDSLMPAPGLFSFSTSGRYLAAVAPNCGGRRPSIVTWDLTTGKLVRTLAIPCIGGQSYPPISALLFSPDDTHLIAGTPRLGAVSDQYTTYIGDWSGVRPAAVYIWESGLP